MIDNCYIESLRVFIRSAIIIELNHVGTVVSRRDASFNRQKKSKRLQETFEIQNPYFYHFTGYTTTFADSGEVVLCVGIESSKIVVNKCTYANRLKMLKLFKYFPI